MKKNKIPEKLSQPPPVSAMRMTAPEPVEVRESNGNDKALKVHIKARSKMSVDHFWWGPFVHDFSTMSMPPRVAIDDTHGHEIGFGRPYLTEYGVEIDGTVIPNAENADHAANRIAYNLSNQIPQEASIDFNAPFDVEYLMEGQYAEVNGVRVDGPMSIIRNWSLRSCAICKEGMDNNTETTLMNQGKAAAPRTVAGCKFALSDSDEEEEDEDKKKKPPEGDESELDGDDDEKPKETEQSEEEEETDRDQEIKDLEEEIEGLKKQIEEMSSRLSAFPKIGAPPASMSQPKASKEDLWKQYAALSPSDKTAFWRKHKNQMKSN